MLNLYLSNVCLIRAKTSKNTYDLKNLYLNFKIDYITKKLKFWAMGLPINTHKFY